MAPSRTAEDKSRRSLVHEQLRQDKTRQEPGTGNVGAEVRVLQDCEMVRVSADFLVIAIGRFCGFPTLVLFMESDENMFTVIATQSERHMSCCGLSHMRHICIFVTSSRLIPRRHAMPWESVGSTTAAP